MLTQFFPRLSKNCIEIMKDDEYYDLTIGVGDDSNVKIFHAHDYSVLSSSIFTSNKKNNNVLAHVKLQNISPEIFQISITFIYTLLNIFI